jgi:hypothetical protein
MWKPPAPLPEKGDESREEKGPYDSSVEENPDTETGGKHLQRHLRTCRKRDEREYQHGCCACQSFPVRSTPVTTASSVELSARCASLILKTLSAYLDHDGSVERAGEVLHCHANTLSATGSGVCRSLRERSFAHFEDFEATQKKWTHC